MLTITISKRNLFIDDMEIVERIGVNKLNFYLHKEKSGDIVLIAEKSNKGRKVTYGRDRVKVNTPALLKDLVGEEVDIYTELLRPESREVFRIRPVNFKFKGARKVGIVPKFTNSSIVIPQHYFNKYSRDLFYNGMGIRFRHTTKESLQDGYIIAEMADLSIGKTYRDDSRLQQCGAGVRSCGISTLLDFLENNAKNINNYKYEGFMDNLVFFKEVI